MQSVGVIVAHMARTKFPLYAHLRTLPTILLGLGNPHILLGPGAPEP